MKTEFVVFLVSALIAAAQMVLLAFLFKSLKQGRRGISFLIMFVKLISYIALIYILIYKFMVYTMFGLCGFLSGLPISVILILIYVKYFKGKIRFKKV